MKKLFIILFLSAITVSLRGQNFIRMGSDIDGEAASDLSGVSVSLDSDGDRVAIGALYNDGTGDNAGHVRVYSYSSGSWTQLGSDIDGEAAGDEFGVSVSLDSDGDRLAVGAWKNGGLDAGHVRVYSYSSGSWTQLGSDIDGEADTDYSGYSVSLDSDGDRVAIGAFGNSSATGHVRVYQYSESGSWTQLGSDIDGEATGDRSGFSVSLDSDGDRVAIGAPENDGTGTGAGHVRVYEYSNTSWTQLGSDIDGEAAEDEFGYSVSLDSDGDRVAIGGDYNDGNGTDAGHVRIYEYSNTSWTQLGSDIDGEAAYDEFGYSVSLDSDGDRVAIGAQRNNGNGSDAGHVRIYEYSNTSWTQLGSDIDGESSGDWSGVSVSLDSDGDRLAVGAPYNDGTANNAGHARVMASTTTWWVDSKNGNDNNDGIFESSAFKTIHWAIDYNSNLTDGDTIKVKPSLDSDGALSYYDFGGGQITTSKTFVLISTAGAATTILDAESKNRHFYINGSQDSTLQIIGFTFKNGKTEDDGGSIYMNGNARAVFRDCIFEANRLVDPNYGSRGGAVYHGNPNSSTILNDPLKFVRCKFIQNEIIAKHSAYGGAVYSQTSTEFINCLFANNRTIAGEGDDSENHHESLGGAVVADARYHDGTNWISGYGKFLNCTFVDNYVTLKTNNGPAQGAAIFSGWDEGRKLYMINTIIRGGKAYRGGAERTDLDRGDDLNIELSWGSNHQIISDYNNIEYSAEASWANDHTYDVPPVFKDETNDDFSLDDASPMIGAGIANWESIVAPTKDINNTTRGTPPDIGAYEHSDNASLAPQPVMGVTGVAATYGAKLTWSANVDALGSTTAATDIKRYEVHQLYNSSYVVVDSVTTNTATIKKYWDGTKLVSNLVHGTAYTFKVRAVNTSDVAGGFSDPVEVTPEFKGPKWYVSTTGLSTSEGSSTAPLSHLSGAIEKAATGDTIVVLKGTHSGSSNRAIDFSGSKPLVIMGDPSYVADSTIIDAGGKARHFLFNSGEDTTYQIIGLTLFNGSSEHGGSVRVDNNSRPRFKKVIFKGNNNSGDQWTGGGAVYIDWASAIFRQCTFEGNVNDRTDHDQDSRGGALYVGYHNSGQEVTKIFSCIFKNNTVLSHRWAGGGAVYSRESPIWIENSLFYNNTTTSSIDNSDTHQSSGGAIYIDGPSTRSSNEWVGTDVMLINNTVVNNSALSENSNARTIGGGIVLNSWERGEKWYVFNNIFWGNKVSQYDYDKMFIQGVVYGNSENLKLYRDYNVYQGYSSEHYASGDYSLGIDPLFVNSSGGNFSLSEGSHLIGAGTAQFEGISAPTNDILGNPRPNPSGSSVDIGAYENALSISTYPAPVKNLAGSPIGSGADLSWDANTESDIAYYLVAVSNVSGFLPTDADTVGRTTNTTYSVTGLQNSTSYYFRVKAVNTSNQSGAYAQEIMVTPFFDGPTWYVATDGSDANDGSESNPLATLNRAISSAKDGHTVKLKAGTYYGEDFKIYLQSQNLNIEGEGPELTIIDADNNFRIFQLNRGTYKISNLTLANGRYEWQGGAVEAHDANIEFNNVIFRGNNARQGGAVFASCYEDLDNLCSYKFNDCQFLDNMAEYKTNDEGNNWGGKGGAVSGYAYVPGVPYEFNRCIFKGNTAQAKKSEDGRGGALNIDGGANIVNCLFYNNQVVNYDAFCEDFEDEEGNSWTNCSTLHAGAVKLWSAWYDFNLEEWIGSKSSIINSTFVGNKLYLDGDSGKVRFSTAILLDGRYTTGYDSNTEVVLFNNIFYGNESEDLINGNEEINLDIHAYNGTGGGAQNASDLYIMDHNLVENIDDYNVTWMSDMIGLNDFDEIPGFKNPIIEDFSLHSFSEAIGRGALEFEGFSAPTVDITGKSRPIPPDSPPDVGAYEQGLGFDVVFSPDSGVVDSGEEMEVTLTVKDWNGVSITDGTSLYWGITPDSLGISVKSGDSSTKDGQAKATVKVDSDAQTGIQFRVTVFVGGDIPINSNSFFVGQKVIAPPPAPENISISPQGWTADNNFTIKWDKIDWIYDMSGAWLKFDGDSDPHYFSLSNNNELKEISMPENGEFTIKVWLEDEFQQSDEANSAEVVARWDDTSPYDFDLVSPGGWNNQDTTVFEWRQTSDNASGLAYYDLYIDGEVYGVDPYPGGTDPEVHSIKIDKVFPQEDIVWYVEAVDHAGNIKKSQEWTINIDRVPPNLSHSPVTMANLGESVTIGSNADDSRSGLMYLELFYRIGGEDQLQGPYDLLSGDHTISGANVTTEGLSYFIEAADQAWNITTSPAEGAHEITVTIPGDGQLSEARWPSGVPAGKEVTNYQLISFPIIPDNGSAQAILEDDLGTYDNFIWRFYGYSGGGNYQEYPSVNVQPGFSYFLITTQEGITIDTDAGRTANTSEPFEINLNSGDWTLIGNPFDFDIPLERITTNEGATLVGDPNAYAFNGDWRSASTMKPWDGFAYKSATANKLYIEPRSSMRLAREGSGGLEEGEWLVDISANNGFGTDNLNTVGVRYTALDGYDRLDGYEPPMLPGGISLRMPHDDWEEHNDIYTTDIRSVTDEGQVWDMEVISGNPDFNTWLLFEGLETIPDDFEIFLIDRSTKTAHNLKWKPEYLFDVASPNSRKELRFVAGQKSFVQSNSAGVDLFPDEYSVSQNYPNPFNAQTSLTISLKDDAVIDLEIYNLLGERVAVMAKREFRPSGYYTFIWDGKDGYGNSVASGVYLAYGRMASKGGKTMKTQSRKLVLVK